MIPEDEPEVRRYLMACCGQGRIVEVIDPSDTFYCRTCGKRLGADQHVRTVE
jgi:hypothetical protein